MNNIRVLLASGAAALLALLPIAAQAHPLGNFTVNHYSRIEPAGDGIHVRYVLDMAEIPTFQEKPRIDPSPEAYADQRAEELRQNLSLSVDGTSVPLRTESRALSFPEGQGGLPTLRLEVSYVAPLPTDTSHPLTVDFRDDNDPSRIGWREVIATPGSADTQIQQSNVPAADTTDELRNYPQDLLSSPLNVREAHLTFVPGAAAAQTHASTPLAAIDRTNGAFAALGAARDLSLPAILLALVIAVFFGAQHALQPGHGKTIVAAYLVGSRGTAKHALFLGATVTATHTAGVYALGLVTLFLSQYILPERLYPVLELGSGLLVVGIGLWLLGTRLIGTLRARGQHTVADHQHGHSHEHGHDHVHVAVGSHQHTHHTEHDHHEHEHAELVHSHGGHTHSHLPPGADGKKVTWRSLLALGISGGLLPCPEALMVLLGTMALGRVAFGLLLIVAFSIGLAGVLVGFGLLLVYARGFFRRIDFSAGLAPRLLSVASALVIVVAGGAITLQALPQMLS